MLACAESLISQNEFLRKTIVACLSGSQMGLIHEIKNAKNSRDTATLRPHQFKIQVKKQMADAALVW